MIFFVISKPHDIFCYLSTKTYVVGTRKKRLGEAFLMSTHNICFCGELRKKYQYISVEKSALSGAMKQILRKCHTYKKKVEILFVGH